MSNTDVAIQTTRLPIQPEPKRKPKIGNKLKRAIDLVVFEGAELQEAAAGAGLTTYQLRQAFGRAHVITYLKQRREVFRAAINGKNIYRLDKIANSGNQPAVNAIRLLEQIDEAESGRTQTNTTPHVTVKIVSVGAAFPQGKPQPQTISDMSHPAPDAMTIPADDQDDRRGEK